MALEEQRERYLGSFNSNIAFTIPGGETWLIQSLTTRITTVGGGTVLHISHRDSGANVIGHLTRQTSIGVETKAIKNTEWDGVVLEAADDIFFDQGSGTTEVEVLVNYIELT